MSSAARPAYDAFLSYSHGDVAIAALLHQQLERFARPFFRLRSMRIFRDTANLAMSSDLSGELREALDTSSHFLLVASPSSARSEWVVREGLHFLERSATAVDRFGIVLVDGQTPWTNHGPAGADAQAGVAPALLDAIERRGLQPLVVDLREYRNLTARQRWLNRGYQRAIAQIAAFALGRELDSIYGDHRRRNAMRWSAMGMAALTMLGTVGILETQRRAQLRHAEEIRIEQQRQEEKRRLEQQRQDEALREANAGFAATRFEERAVHLGRAYALGAADRGVLVGLARAMRFFDLRTSLAGSGARMSSLAFSPDGRLVASFGSDGIHVWDVGTGKQRCHGAIDMANGSITEVHGELAVVDSVVASEEQQRHSLALVEVNGCKVVGRLDGEEAIGLSDDGSRLATIAGKDVVLRDARGAEVARVSASQDIIGARLAPSGRRVVVATRATVEVLAFSAPRLWSVRERHEGYVQLAFLQDGNLLAVVNKRTARVFDISGRLVAEGHLPNSEGGIRELRAGGAGALLVALTSGGVVLGWLAGHSEGFVFPVSPVGGLLSAVSDACVAPPFVYVAEADTIEPGVTGFEAWSGLPLMFAQGPANGISTLRFSPRCDRLAIAGRDGSLQVIATQQQGSVTAVDVHPTELVFRDPQHLVVVSTSSALDPRPRGGSVTRPATSSPQGQATEVLRRTLEEALHPRPHQYDTTVETFTVDADGRPRSDRKRVFQGASSVVCDREVQRFAVADVDQLRLYKGDDAEPVAAVAIDSRYAWSVWFDPGSERWAVADNARTEIHDGKDLIARIDGPSRLAEGYALVERGDHRDYTVELYDLASVPHGPWHTPVPVPMARTQALCNAAVQRASGVVVALASCDGRVDVWEQNAGKLSLRLEPSRKPEGLDETYVSLDRSGTRLAVAAPNGEGALYDTRGGGKLAAFGDLLFRGFCPTGELYAVEEISGAAEVHRASDGQLVARLDEGSGRVEAFGFSPDCSEVAVMRADRALQLYDLVSKRVVATVYGPRAPDPDLANVAWRPDGKQIFLGMSPTLVLGVDVAPEQRTAGEIEGILQVRR